MRHAAILFALVAFLATACGAEKSGLDASPGAMNDAGTSRVELRLVETKPAFIGTGTFDYAHDRGQLVVTDAPGTSMVPGGKMVGRFFGRTSYTGWTLFGKERWVKESDTAPSGTDRLLPGPGGPNPDRLLGVLIKSSKEIESLGNEDIRGVSTKHYRAHIDPNKLGDDVVPADAEIVVDAWIDEQGLVRRLRVPEEEEGATVVDYFDFGVEVDVEEPPADQIISDDEFSNLLDKWCKARPKGDENQLCALSIGEGSGGEIEPTPVQTVEK